MRWLTLFVASSVLVLSMIACGSEGDGTGDPTPGAPAPGAPKTSGPPATPPPGEHHVDVPAAPAGQPIVAPDRTWTWVPFPEARCMNDTPTGIGVSLSSKSDKVVIVLEGGGACFDDATCIGGTINQNGVDETVFDAEVAVMGNSGILDRNDKQNPFADWSYVFVPYCTGDIHAGNNPNGWQGKKHVGYVNIGHYLARLVPTFAKSSQVVLTGSSAGGFGAAYNFDRVQTAFGATPVHLIDDSGPPLPDAYLKPCLQKRLRDAWNLDATLPADCAACKTSFLEIAKFLGQKYPSRRAGIISGQWDEVIRTFYSAGYSPDCKSPAYFPPGDYQAALDGLHAAVAPYPNVHVYYVASTWHTWLMQPVGLTSVNGVTLASWLRGFVDGTAAFRDVTP